MFKLKSPKPTHENIYQVIFREWKMGLEQRSKRNSKWDAVSLTSDIAYRPSQGRQNDSCNCSCTSSSDGYVVVIVCTLRASGERQYTVCLFDGPISSFRNRQQLTNYIVAYQTGFVGKGIDHRQLIKFWPSRAPGKGICGGGGFWLRLTEASAQCLRLSERFLGSTL